MSGIRFTSSGVAVASSLYCRTIEEGEVVAVELTAEEGAHAGQGHQRAAALRREEGPHHRGLVGAIADMVRTGPCDRQAGKEEVAHLVGHALVDRSVGVRISARRRS